MSQHSHHPPSSKIYSELNLSLAWRKHLNPIFLCSCIMETMTQWRRDDMSTHTNFSENFLNTGQPAFSTVGSCRRPQFVLTIHAQKKLGSETAAATAEPRPKPISSWTLPEQRKDEKYLAPPLIDSKLISNRTPNSIQIDPKSNPKGPWIDSKLWLFDLLSTQRAG